MAAGTTIEKLFLTLGLDMTALDSDLLTAGKTVQQGMSDLSRKTAQAKLKMEIDMSQFKGAESSTDALTAKTKNLNDQLTIQKQKVSIMNAAYAESVQAKGADYIGSQKLLTSLLREQKAEADLSAQIKQTNEIRKQQSASVSQAAIDKINQERLAEEKLALQIKQTTQAKKDQDIVNSKNVTHNQKTSMDTDLAGVKGGENSTAGLKIKSEQLTTQLASQQKTVQLLNRAHAEAVTAEGAHSNSAQKLLRSLREEQLAEAKLAQQIKQTNQAKHERIVSNVSDGVQGSAMSLAPATGAGIGALKLAVDAVESENLWRESMGKMTQEGKEWSQNLRKDLGLNEFEVRKSTGMLNTMFESMGMGTQGSYDLATGITKLGYDMASFYNVSTDDAFLKLKSGMTGEMEPLKALGILVDETTVKNYAYTNGIAEQGQELNTQQKVLARYGTIMDQTKRAQGDMARTINDPANAMRVLKENVVQVGIEFGQTLIPALQEFIKAGKGTVDTYNNMDESAKLATNSVAKSAVELGGVLTVMAGFGMVASMISPWVALATAVGVATKGLLDYVDQRIKLKELDESRKLGFDPSETVAKVRFNDSNNSYEKETIRKNMVGQEYVVWLKLEGAELVEAQARKVIADIKQARREQLESITETKTGKPLTKDRIDETLKDEFDEKYSTEKWEKNFQRDQDNAKRQAAIEAQAAAERIKANTDLNAEISKLRDSDFQNEMHSLSDKYKELKKAKVDEVKLAEWAELAKKEVINKAQSEYLSGLDKMRQAQIANSEAMIQVGAIKDGMQDTASGITFTAGSINLHALENQQIAFNLWEKQANSTRLSEKLSIIQQMLEDEESGTRRRKELLEQEVSASGEYTRSIIDGVKSAKQEIESLQSKSMSAASQAMSSLEKYFPKENNYTFYKELAKSNEEAWNASSTHTMAQLNQEMELLAQLEKAGVRSNVKIKSGDFKDAYRDSVKGVPESIAQAQTSMASFYSQINDIGKSMTQNYFDEWRQNLDKLKNDIGGDFQGATNGNYGYTPPVMMQDRQPTQAELNLQANGYTGSEVQGITVSDLGGELARLSQAIQSIGGVSGNQPMPATNTAQTASAGITVNSQNAIEFKGFTSDEITKAVDRAKDAFGKELYTAIQDAKTQYGI